MSANVPLWEKDDPSALPDEVREVFAPTALVPTKKTKKGAKKNRHAFLATTLASEHLVGIAEDGALVFTSFDDGEALGALRLASTEPPSSWHLATVSGSIIVLALGDWLVWIDARARKTVRRVRAAARVTALCADRESVACGIEGGRVQAFRAESGEPRASFVAHDDDVDRVALGAEALYTRGGAMIRAWDKKTLDAVTRTGVAVTAIASRGDLVATGDKSGRVRIAAGRETGAVAIGEPVVSLHVAKDDVVVAVSARVLMRAARPWSAPRPIVLRAPPTAFAADDAYSFVGTGTGAVDVYDTARALTSYALTSDDRITALVRCGKVLVAGTGALDGRVIVVDVEEAKVVHKLEPHDEAFGVTCLACDPRGRIVASGSDDGTIALLDPTKGKVLARLRVTETPVSLAFEPTGRRLACAFADGTSAIVTLTAKGATLADTGFRGVAHVVWTTSGPGFVDKEGTIRRDVLVNTRTVAEA